MLTYKDYRDYLADNPKGYWFKNKLYGWGWTPVKWQGWLVVALYIIFTLAFALTIDDNSTPRELVFTFFLPITILTTTLIRICYLKGEKPRWRWGLQDNKK